VQIQLQRLAAAIGRAFFRDWRPEEPEALMPEIPGSSQSQSQSQSSGAAQGGPERNSGGRTEALA